MEKVPEKKTGNIIQIKIWEEKLEICFHKCPMLAELCSKTTGKLATD